MNRTTISTQNRFAAISDASVKISEKDFQAFLRMKEENAKLKRENKNIKKQSIKTTLRLKELEIAYQDQVHVIYEAKENVLKAEENVLKNIEAFQDAEMKAISERMSFFELLIKRVKQFNPDLDVNLFGGFPRRALQQRSKTEEEHKRWMDGFKESDLDIRFYYNKTSESNLVDILTNIATYGLNLNPLKLEVLDLREIISGFETTQHAKCVFTYKGKKIKADVFNKYEINFSCQDYSCNQLSLSATGITLNKPINSTPFSESERHYGIETIRTLMELQKKEAKPLFTEETELTASYMNNMKKMIKRQEKMINEGFNLTREIISSDVVADCPICYQPYASDAENSVKQFGFALCGCSFGKTICRCCYARWPTLCPQCKIPWKIAMTKDEDKDALEQFILPMMRRIELNRGVDIYGEAIEEENDISSDFE